MRSFTNIFLALALVTFTLVSCNNEPKKISENNAAVSTEELNKKLQNKLGEEAKQVADDIHKVTVVETLPATSYAYLKVEENGEEYWIATGKKEIKVGEKYLFQGGLPQANFESKELGRTFDKLILVTNLVKDKHGAPSQTTAAAEGHEVNKSPSMDVEDIVVEGSTRIADLVANPAKYEGKTVQISGKCTKVNKAIMSLNWIHLKDGSKNDFDMIVTTDELVEVGEIVTMEAKVVLNKDFGAGYKYDLILQEGKVIK